MKKIFVCIMMSAILPASSAYALGPYPITVHSSGRYLVDNSSTPFLMLGSSPQGMVVRLSPTEMETYISTRAAQGVNAIQVEVIAGSIFAATANYGTYDGITPFTTPGDISTPREAYFSRIDNVLSIAARYGVLVFLNAMSTHPTSAGGVMGLWQSNGTTKCNNWGRYLGTRFGSHKNLIWVIGNDFQSWRTTSDMALATAVLDGLTATAPSQLHTAWMDYFVSSSRDSADINSRIQLDLVYTYYATYIKTLASYALSPEKPIHMGEANYEGDALQGYTATPNIIRRQNYWSLLSGASGTFFEHLDMWKFPTGWASDLNTTAFQELVHLKNLFNGFRWWTLIPDSSHVVLTAGYGTFDGTGTNTQAVNTSDYVTAAMTSDNTTMLAYLPTSRTVTVNMGKFAGGNITARWFNPENGTWTAIGTYAASGNRSFTPSSGDWVLVLSAAGQPDTLAPAAPMNIRIVP